MTRIDLDLRDNVNLRGTPPSTLAAITSAATDAWRYPEAEADRLAEAIAADAGARPREVVAGCGSDDIIDSFLRAMSAPGDVLAHPEPTFGMIASFARLNGLRTVGVPLLADGSADVDGLVAVGATITYVASPNNPTGTITPPEAMRRLIERAPGALLIDEAYAEFTDAPDWRREAAGRDRLLVTRTFSKAWGLAGLRVGYGIGSAAVASAVARARGPYKVNRMAAAAAAAALAADRDWMRSTAREAAAARDRLTGALAACRGARAWRSEANFAFAAVEDAPAVEAAFAARGIGVRRFERLAGIGDAVRIGVAPEPALSRVLRAIEEVLA